MKRSVPPSHFTHIHDLIDEELSSWKTRKQQLPKYMIFHMLSCFSEQMVDWVAFLPVVLSKADRQRFSRTNHSFCEDARKFSEALDTVPKYLSLLDAVVTTYEEISPGFGSRLQRECSRPLSRLSAESPDDVDVCQQFWEKMWDSVSGSATALLAEDGFNVDATAGPSTSKFSTPTGSFDLAFLFGG